ncbi:hypothetical protein ABWH92_16645 [Ahrensia marina]|uniref:hypothetical protein n=1 Tax=Ahrensia marina TaxID=1514904 RepID=UPI0035CFB050
MSRETTLNAVVDWLVRQRFATLETVWLLTLPDVRRATRIAAPPQTNTPPTPDDLAALMRAFPDILNPPEKCYD